MRGWLLAVVLVGCGDSMPDPDDDGTLIAIDEGAPPVTRQVASGARTWADAPWATVDDAGQLVIAPGCDTVPGTSGPPRLFPLEGADGDRTLVVQVNPSLTGTCLPRVVACVRNADTAPCTDDMFQDQTTGVHADSLLGTGFCATGCPDPTGDEVLELRLDNPDRNDPNVSARITTDAPIQFTASPLNFRDTLTGNLFDAEITGDFLVSYEIVRDMISSQRLGIGNYHLLWDGGRNGFGIEGEYCTSSAGCQVRHDPTRDTTTGSQCMVSPAEPIELGVRIWVAANAQTGGGDRMVVSGAVIPGGTPVVFHSESDTSVGAIELPLASDGARPLFVEAGNANGADVHLEVEACSSGGTTMGAPLCSSLPDGIPDVRTVIALRATLGGCP